YYRLKSNPGISFAGQITGVEGYVESAASGLVAGIAAACDIMGIQPPDIDRDTAIGALACYISSLNTDFQPMNINFGLITPIKIRDKRKRAQAMYERSKEKIQAIKDYIQEK
ncbi:MAG TPA: FAD-dependent oxidoreductase, partial [Clostridia bacterium]|nr:FAD-dependent oxidoreductase [Clostridia bacterium]